MSNHFSERIGWKVIIAFLVAIALSLVSHTMAQTAKPVSRGMEIQFRSFSSAIDIEPPALAYAAQLQKMSRIALGERRAIALNKIAPTPKVPERFNGNVLAAVAAGGVLAGGDGFDAAYVSGGALNPVWGFLYGSGFPFGPSFDEYLGFLYGDPTDAPGESGLELLQTILEGENANVVVIPIAAGAQQGSGYFTQPVGDANSAPGIGLAGLCQQNWTFRYLPPAEDVLDRACDRLVAARVIPRKNIRFIKAVPGLSTLDAVLDGKITAFEYVTPYGDTQLFKDPSRNPATVGLRYLHFPAWHQPFLITYMVFNRQVWDSFDEAQQELVTSMGRDRLVSSYSENLKKQGPSLQKLLSLNKGDNDSSNDLELVQWPASDLALLREAAREFLDTRANDPSLAPRDRDNYRLILNRLREYVGDNRLYWQHRSVPMSVRF